MRRRDLGAALLASLLTTAGAAWAEGKGETPPLPPDFQYISAPDVVVYCDTTLGTALQAVGDAYRAETTVPIRVFPASGPLNVALIAHGTRNDVLVTQTNWMDDAAARRLIKESTRIAAVWRDPLVLAGRGAAGDALPDPAGIVQALGGGQLGVIDPVHDGGMDGPAVVQRLGWQVPVAGVLDGSELAFRLTHEAGVPLGLLPRTSALATPELRVVATLPEAAAPATRYTAAVSKNIQSRNAVPFVAYLDTPKARDILRQAGLEIETVSASQ